MRALDIDAFASCIAGSAIELDHLWLKRLDAITPMDVQLLYARAGIAGHRRVAEEAISSLQSELLVLAALGKVEGRQLRLVLHEVPDPRFTVDDLVSCLMKTSRPRRQAILFALATNAEPSDVASMEWRSVQHQGVPTGIPQEVMKQRTATRHIRLPYVFWESATEKIAAPLLRLQQDAEKAFGMAWPSIQTMWTSMIWVSAKSEAHALRSVIAELKQGRL